MHSQRSVIVLLAASSLALGAVACRSAYYGTLEAFGVHKRDVLVDRVEEGRDAQQAAKEQFQSALEAFRAVEDFDGGGLEKLYDELKHELDASEKRVAAVSGRIDSIETVAADLFAEWQGELDEMQSADLRRRSEETLARTKERYSGLIAAMKRAESKMEPVLGVFRDHVLFLKHNLNAQAIASLEGSLASIESDVGNLIRDMEASIAEADAFIETIEGA
jgi:hypothetical protein